VAFAEELGTWWAPALAFAAGVVSCASPCVLPLLPGYLSFVTGTPAEGSRRPLLPVLLFVLGFAVVFSAAGAFSRLLVPVLLSPTGQRVAGGVVVAIGALMLLEAVRVGLPALYAERRPFLSRVRPGPAGAFPLGMALRRGVDAVHRTRSGRHPHPRPGSGRRPMGCFPPVLLLPRPGPAVRLLGSGRPAPDRRPLVRSTQLPLVRRDGRDRDGDHRGAPGRRAVGAPPVPTRPPPLGPGLHPPDLAVTEKTRRPAVRLALIAASLPSCGWWPPPERPTSRAPPYASPTPCPAWKARPSWGAGPMRPCTGGRSRW
jgi:hypothetical protein